MLSIAATIADHIAASPITQVPPAGGFPLAGRRPIRLPADRIPARTPVRLIPRQDGPLAGEQLRDRPAAEQRGYWLAGQRAGAVRQLHDDRVLLECGPD
ncbi:MAG: hypothetical protein QOG28_7065 [Trebonia sp.]|nr:hypothetical protein [Trebonia sp.]